MHNTTMLYDCRSIAVLKEIEFQTWFLKKWPILEKYCFLKINEKLNIF